MRIDHLLQAVTFTSNSVVPTFEFIVKQVLLELKKMNMIMSWRMRYGTPALESTLGLCCLSLLWSGFPTAVDCGNTSVPLTPFTWDLFPSPCVPLI